MNKTAVNSSTASIAGFLLAWRPVSKTFSILPRELSSNSRNVAVKRNVSRHNTKNRKMIARIALIVLALIMNYFVLDIYFETKNTPQAIGGTMYMLLFWIITMIIAICTCYFTGFKKLTKTDFVLLSLCTPLSSMIVILLS
jgi:hypothetical protein